MKTKQPSGKTTKEFFSAVYSVFRYELQSYLSSPGLYAVVLAYVLIPTYLFFRSAYLSGNADIEPLFDALSWALLLFAPALSMRQLTEERRTGIYEVFVSNPVSEVSIVFGKLLSVAALILIANSLFLILPAVLSPFGAFDTGKIISGFLAVNFLAVLLISISLFASSLTTNQYTAFLISTALILISYLFSFDFILLALPAQIRNLAEFISPLYQFNSMTRGVIDFSSIIYFLAGSWFFSYASSLKLRSIYAVMKEEKRVYSALWVISVMLFTSLLVLALRTPARADLTREKIYTLSDSTKEVLNNLDSKLVIKVYASRELPPEISVVYRDVRNILDEYKRASRGKIEVYYAEPDVNPKAKIEASNYGIPPIQFNVISNEEYKVKEGYFGLAVLYGGKSDTIPMISSIGNFELQLTSTIYGLTNKLKKKIGVISDAGCRNQFSGARILTSILAKQYQVEEVFVSEKSTKLENYDVLLVLGPSTAFETTVTRKLKDYLLGGGSMFVAADMVRVNPQEMTGENTSINVNDITGPVGLTLDPNVILDLKSHENVIVGGENQYVVPYPFWVRPVISQTKISEVLFGTRSRMVLLWPSSIELHKRKNSKVYPLLKTTKYAASQQNFYMLEPTQNFESYSSRLKEYVLAGAAEFKGKNHKGRLIAVGDAEFLDDTVVQQNQENLAFVYASIHWLARENILLGLKQKQLRPPALSFPDKTIREGIRYFVLIFEALLIVFFGLVFRFVHLRGLRNDYVS